MLVMQFKNIRKPGLPLHPPLEGATRQRRDGGGWRGTKGEVLIKKYILSSFIIFSLLYFSNSFAQDSVIVERQKIAIFAPLYLDSAFDANNEYKHGINFPRYISPGLEFYEGAQLALDSLAKENLQLEVYVYDTRSVDRTLQEQFAELEENEVRMIIAYTSVNEIQQFAYAAQKMKIPFINVNLPNDGGVYENPYFVLLNPTLKTHIESIYRYMQKYHALDEIIVFRKKGQIEGMISNYIDNYSKNTMSVPLRINYVDLTDSFTVRHLTARLDSNINTVVVAGSLDENFGKRLALQLASISKQYKLTLMGMPTFDNMDREFSRPEYKGLPIVYSTPFYNPRTDKVSQGIIQYFNTKIFARPSDMVMRGYEATWRFSKLLLQHKDDIASNLTKKEYNIFREFDIQPVFGKPAMTLDYFENKKLFFLRWQDGLIKVTN